MPPASGGGGGASKSDAGAPRSAARPPEGHEEGEELDWELVEAAATAPGAEPLVIDDYLVVDSPSEDTDLGDDGVGPGDDGAGSAPTSHHTSEAGMATPRQSTSEDEGHVEPLASAATTAGAEKPNQECETPPESPTREPSEKVRPGSHDDTSDASSTTAEDAEPAYGCLACKLPIFKACEIISSNYHAETSPGYLLSAVRNISVGAETTAAVYTTGRYEVQKLMCRDCSAVLGVTYSRAWEARNQYKVGKYLVGRDRLQLPPGVEHPMDKAKV